MLNLKFEQQQLCDTEPQALLEAQNKWKPGWFYKRRLRCLSKTCQPLTEAAFSVASNPWKLRPPTWLLPPKQTHMHYLFKVLLVSSEQNVCSVGGETRSFCFSCGELQNSNKIKRRLVDVPHCWGIWWIPQRRGSGFIYYQVQWQGQGVAGGGYAPHKLM